ncbi:hypothetical protein [Wukongibacter sp. M2B1]|uniref:hypothetical protein n=1 Tax=Wukongibacter sp. M2B1 TaxID=3088895 RepID=UPI003D799D2D
MKIPDLVGIKIEDVSDVIRSLKNSYNITIRETASPFKRNEYKKSECRVVRQQNFDNTIIITVSYI